MSRPLKSYPEAERVKVARRRVKSDGIGGVVAREFLAKQGEVVKTPEPGEKQDAEK